MKPGIIISVFLTLFLSSHANSATFNSLSTWTSSPTGVGDIDERLRSDTGSVEYDSTPGTTAPLLTSGFSNDAEVAGSADFGVLKVETFASANNFNDYFASSSADTSFSVIVNAAPVPIDSTAGLSFGDSVSLDLSFRLDGNVRSGAAFGDTTGYGGIGAKLRVTDSSTIGVDCYSPDGCYTPRLLDFEAGAYQTSSGLSDNVYVDEGWNWNLRTTSLADPTIPIDPDGLIDQYITDEQRDSYRNDYYTVGSSCSGGITGPGCGTLNFDTGILSTTIDTTIGATLDITGSLDAFSQAWNDAYGSVDFLNTYGILLVAITEGVELDYGGITPAEFTLGEAPSAVPIPAAIWLFGSAMIGLVGMNKRKKASGAV